MVVLSFPIGLAGAGHLAKNWLHPIPTNGTVLNNNRVMAKADANAPEVPAPGKRVRLHRLVDGHCAWEGLSDADGYYHAVGLEVGLEYYPVAIDPSGTHECVAAGPVVAVKAPA